MSDEDVQEEVASRVPFIRDVVKEPECYPMMKLIKGSEIELIEDMPKYRVTELVVADPASQRPASITMKLQGAAKGTLQGATEKISYEMPEQILFRGDKTFLIGRGKQCDAIVECTKISRTHASVHYDSRRKSFILSGLNTNRGYGDNVVVPSREQQQDLLAGANTIQDSVLPPVMAEVPLRPGQLIKIRKDEIGYAEIPPYEVKKAVGGVKPELLLEINGDAHGFPPRISLIGKDASAALGLGSANYNFAHPKISRLHASIAWDDSHKNWTYSTLNEPPEVHMGNRFLADMRQAADEIQPADTAQAKMQIGMIDALINGMQEVRGKMRNVEQMMGAVQGLERHTIATPEWERGRGAHTEDSQKGYKNWIDAYRILYQDQQNSTQRAALKQASEAVGDIGVFREELRRIEEYAESLRQRYGEAKFANERAKPTALQKQEFDILSRVNDPKRASTVTPKEVLMVVDRLNFKADLDKLVEMEMKSLQKEPPQSFPVSGYEGHHTVTRIQKDDKGYVVTTYNTGGRAKWSPNDGSMVMGMYRQRLNPKSDIKDFVKLLNVRKMMGDDTMGNGVEKVMEGMLGPVIEHRDEPPQHKGNCTTRSTREMLKDILSELCFPPQHCPLKAWELATLISKTTQNFN
ncbi:MAG: FHA domain-containing protein, partial [Proteobacteria bacterium]|nr:FHA domain-containing protein [Pseudomonadota bacterium]